MYLLGIVMGRVYMDHSKTCQNGSIDMCYNEDNTTGKTALPMRFSHLMAFNIREGDDQISGILTIEFDYFSYNDKIKYRDMSYSDPRLIKHIEGNPLVMKNIDSYLRKYLLESEYGLTF